MRRGFERRSSVSRLLAGASGQFFARSIQALSVILWPGLMLKTWGLQGYGEWLTLTSVAAFLSYSDFGLVTPSGNEIVMAAGSRDFARARLQLRRALSFALFIVAPCLIVPTIVLSEVDIVGHFHFQFIGAAACRLVLFGSAASAFLRTLRGLVVATLYAHGDYGLAYASAGAVRLIEFALVTALLILAAEPSSVAMATALIAVVDLAVVAAMARSRVAWATFRPQMFDIEWIRRLARPTLGFGLTNLATQGVMLLGPRLLLAAISGGAAVAVYSLYGTMLRLVDQCVLVFLYPLEVELAHSIGHGEPGRTARLIGSGAHASWLVFAVVGTGLGIVGPVLVPLWSHDRIGFDAGFFALTLAMFAANQFGRVCKHALTAGNRLYGPAFWVLGWALLSLALGAAFACLIGVSGMFFAGILAELGVSIIAVVAVTRWLGLTTAQLLFDLSGPRAALTALVSLRAQRARLPRGEA